MITIVVAVVAMLVLVVIPLGIVAVDARRRDAERDREADAAYADALRQYQAAQRIYAATSSAREQMYAEARRHAAEPHGRH